jgi:1-acyl-sn-glycerol-3-phosphate acyltransferase
MSESSREISNVMLRLFRAYTRGFIRRHFHAVRLARGEVAPAPSDRPTIVYLNHSAWWDPLTCVFLAEQFFPNHLAFAPMDAVQLQLYRMLRKVGLFGIERGTVRGGRSFLEIGREILARPRAMIWITPQSRFADVRERPLQFASGLAHLVRHAQHARVVPLAIEYVHWFERLPEILVRFGPAHDAADLCREHASPRELARGLENSLESTMDALARDSASHDDARFVLLLRGGKSVAPLYDIGRRIRALLTGDSFSPGHSLAEQL